MPIRHARIAALLLDWYGRERRILPWRAAPGELQDPWAVWVSEAMLQQVRVATVAPRFAPFLARFPDPAALAAAPIEEALRHWNGLGRYARLHNLHAAARIVAERHGGAVPRAREALLALPGIGPYTAAAIRAMAFGEPDPPMDPNLERVAARLFLVDLPAAEARPLLAAHVRRMLPADRPGDLAQAMMDLGATLCLPRGAPRCGRCPAAKACGAAREGLAESIPAQRPSPPRRVRYAAAFCAMRASDGAVLLRRRPPRGPLGGTLDLPATPFATALPRRAAALAVAAPLPDAAWARRRGEVRHPLSGFEARVVVYAATLDEAAAAAAAAAGGSWVPPHALAEEALAGLARKLLIHARIGAAARHPRRASAPAGQPPAEALPPPASPSGAMP